MSAEVQHGAGSTVRYADYFALQLRLAVLMAERTGLALREALDLYTNLRRRFGLFDADDPDWLAFKDQIVAAPTADHRLALTLKRHSQAPEVPRPAGQVPFGCFACDPPDDAGRVRIHFTNVDIGAEPGPLNAARRGERLAELTAMFGYIRRTFPGARRVIGASWLYNLEAYRRLFPIEYGASRRPTDEPVRLGGTSTWGQMVDHRGLVKPESRARFEAGLETLDVERPWLVFPLRAMAATAPIEAFFDLYGA